MDIFNPLTLLSDLNRKKSDPNHFIFTGEQAIDATSMQLFTYQKAFCKEEQLSSIEQLTPFENKDKNWLNLYGLSNVEIIQSLCEQQGIHSLAIQDILDVNQRPKFQEYDHFSFLTLKSINPGQSGLDTEQISFVFTDHFLISFQEKRADFFDHLRSWLREDKGILRERSCDYLLYAMLESILDNYFKTLNQLENEIDQLSLTDQDKDPLPDTLVIIENHKKTAHFIKKSILPIKEFTQAVERGECKYIAPRHLKYFLEIKDLCLTLIDSSDMLLASLESTTNLFFYIQSHRMNQVMKTLTIVATIFIPLTFVAGIYGMNFVNIPELSWRYGYAYFWGVMLLMLIVMIIYFKRKKWF